MTSELQIKKKKKCTCTDIHQNIVTAVAKHEKKKKKSTPEKIPVLLKFQLLLLNSITEQNFPKKKKKCFLKKYSFVTLVPQINLQECREHLYCM